jgi:hypothetical protein
MISDPIEVELFKNSLFSIADELALTIFRTTYSGVLKDNMDYSTAKLDPFGNIVIDVSVPGVSARLFGRSPWPGLARPSTPSFRSTERLAKTWVPTEQVRGLTAHGTSPATGDQRWCIRLQHFRIAAANAEPDSRGSSVRMI